MARKHDRGEEAPVSTENPFANMADGRGFGIVTSGTYTPESEETQSAIPAADAVPEGKAPKAPLSRAEAVRLMLTTLKRVAADDRGRVLDALAALS